MSDRSIWWHFVNDNRNAKGDGRPGFWWSGRAILHLHGMALRFEWNLKSKFAHAYAQVDDGDDLTLGVALPPVALWFSVEGLKHRICRALGIKPSYQDKARELGVKVFDGKVWWRVWSSPNSWSSRTPRWRDGNFDLVKALFGDVRYSETAVEERDVVVPMPEKAYPATAKLFESTWTHSRFGWPSKRILRVDINVPGGVPMPGKGENSYDCDDDAVFGTTCPARSIEEGVGSLVGSVLRDRWQRGGSHDFTPSDASEAAQ